jgi:hypothetical protein
MLASEPKRNPRCKRAKGLATAKILPICFLANTYGCGDRNGVDAITSLSPLVIAGLKVRNVTFVRLRPTSAIFQSTFLYSDMDYCSKFRNGFDSEDSKRRGFFARACFVLPYLARRKFGILDLRCIRAMARLFLAYQQRRREHYCQRDQAVLFSGDPIRWPYKIDFSR